jgi:nicotinate-nucleotide adenylyltransferase
MIELTIADEEMFSVSDCELRRPAPSYTLDTVRQFKRQYGPGVEIHWLLGADAVNDFVHWHRIEELIDECHLTTMQRAGYESPNFRQFEPIWGAERIRKLQQDAVHTPLVDVSSTEVRNRLRSGRDVRGMLHPDVIEYITKRGLYRRANEETK